MRDDLEKASEPFRRTFLNVAEDMGLPIDDPQFKREVDALVKRLDPKS